ncbi:MAG: hypothetical protein KY455_12920 [Euryarchaeota archaeon]|nr:hypothetical protein [Euryarchaeota archaeon]
MRTLLAFSIFLFTSGAVADAPELGLDADLSPDGVGLHEYGRESTAWSRAYSLSLPDGVTRDSVLDACWRTGELHTVDLCLAPFMTDVHWVDAQCRPVGETALGLTLETHLDAAADCRARLAASR